MNPLVSGGGNTTVGTKDPGSTTKQPDPVTEEPESTTGSSSKGDQTMFYYSTTFSIQVWIVEEPVATLHPVMNVFVMNKGKLTENHCSVADQEGTAVETASGNQVEALVECVFENKVHQ